MDEGPARVRAWRDRLRAIDPTAWSGPLSVSGARAAWEAALDALTDSGLADAIGRPGEPFPAAAVVVARTVSTAPIEWCAVLLGRGTRVVLKHPTGEPGIAPALVEAADAVGLPLTATDDRAALADLPLVVAMGADPSIAAIRAAHPGARVLGFGHRFSIAWITDPASLPAIARDIALHDTRGCMSPAAIATPLQPAAVLDALATAMADAERQTPRGTIGAEEGARIRERRAVARVVGQVREGPGWSVHGLPADRFVPVALPRSIAVHPVPDPAALRAMLAPWSRAVSTIGTDDPGIDRTDWPGARVCAPGQMQRPPLDRLHDGVDWLAATLRR